MSMRSRAGRKAVAGKPLNEKMLELANFGHARASELQAAADELARSNDAERPIEGAWARAHRLWLACTGVDA